ncbi:MAG TPA: AMP-binding protein [Microlunatus sp.]
MTDRLRLADGTAEVLGSLQRSLDGSGVTAPLPAERAEREQTLAMIRPEIALEEADAAAVVATSGSTGRPRGVVLSRSALIASAEATHRRLGGPGTWVLALPAHYVAGLMVLVRSLVADRPFLEVDGRLEALPALEPVGDAPTYLSLVPTQLTRALGDPARAAALRRFDAVLLGGAAADRKLLERAAADGITVVTTYGMSETCGGCVYDGVPLDGVDVTADAGGRLGIGGPMVFAGYRLDPAATADALDGGRLLTRDRGTVDRDGRVTVLGRIDDVVISGGLNVDLAAVERAVRAWAGVEAAVVGVPHAEWGTEVVAVVTEEQNRALVPAPALEQRSGVTVIGRFFLSDLRTALADRLPTYALPRRLVVRPALPRTSGGKINRRQLIADLTPPSADRPEDPA